MTVVVWMEAKGKVVTIQDLYDIFEEEVHTYALNLSKNSEDADDIVQNALIRAMGHLALLGQLNEFEQRTWLFTTVRNLFFDSLRARQRQESLQRILSEEEARKVEPEAAVVHPDPFGSVPEQFRDIVEMKFKEGMSSEEIARKLGIPAATVRSRLHLAMKKLREKQWKWGR